MTCPANLTIKDNDYCVQYEPEIHTVIFEGELQLGSMDDYAPIMALLDEAVDKGSSTLTLDLRKLEFLNSSGINMLLRLVIKVRELDDLHLIVHGTSKVSWQSRSLQNLKRLMPQLELLLD
jgi:hypothetical protein